ncbi:hypothetical protein EV127DRAFT_407331 [Xylaria flabelliformis]|nr:hypothetical protein EV127DRAFT_407331 [Xylaria flabelliformis]
MVGATMIKMLAMAMLSGMQIASALPTSPDGIIETGPALFSRQSGVYITTTNLVGDGNPHQVPWDQQISTKQNCGSAAACSVTVTKEHTLTYGWSVGVGYEWVSGGFSVEESFTDGESHECQGNKGQTVCVWRVYQYTAYTVADTKCYYFNGVASGCTTSKPYVLSSPNKCQKGGFYCKTGSECSNDGYGFWKPNTGFGGPQC